MVATHSRITHLKGREQALEKAWGVDDAEWIALVCLHSGAFTRQQYQAYFNATRWQLRCFVQRLIDRKIAVEQPFPVLWGRPRMVCRISHKSIYRALGEPDIRHRKKADASTLYRRLISLDYVIQNVTRQWLPTEAEKLGAFVGALKVERRLIPRRVYAGVGGGRRVYFPVKMPIALLPDIPAYEFVYIDQGDATGDAVCSWGRDHADLWRALRHQAAMAQRDTKVSELRFYNPHSALWPFRQTNAVCGTPRTIPIGPLTGPPTRAYHTQIGTTASGLPFP